MRSEHKSNGDEWDLLWKKFYCYLARPGVSKGIKRRSHRKDRHAVKQRIKRGDYE